MRRILPVLIVGTLTFGAFAPQAMAQPLDRITERQEEQCRFANSNGRPGYQVIDVRRLIGCAVDVWPVSLSTALYVAERESHFLPRAENRSSGACGIYQHMPRYWDGRLAAFLHQTGPRFHVHHRSCLNARANVLVSIRMAHQGGWDPWGM